MFKDLRPNAPFYVFDRGDNVCLQVGSVASVGQPMVKPQANFNAGYQFQPEYIVDVSIKVGDDVLTFKQLPANLDIADFPANSGQRVVVASNRELIRAEIEAVLANSKAIIDSAPKHERIAGKCEEILDSLNPSLAKEKEQEETIKALQGEVVELREMLGSSMNDIKKMLAGQQQLKPVNNSNNNVK